MTISPAEAARMLGVSADTIRKYVRAGLLPGKLFPGGRVRHYMLSDSRNEEAK